MLTASIQMDFIVEKEKERTNFLKIYLLIDTSHLVTTKSFLKNIFKRT